MDKIEFKNAVKKCKLMVWMNMFDEDFYEIIGVDTNTFEGNNWNEKPINITYLDNKGYVKKGNAHLCEIELSENVVRTPKKKRYRGLKAKTDGSIAPCSNKIANN